MKKIGKMKIETIVKNKNLKIENLKNWPTKKNEKLNTDVVNVKLIKFQKVGIEV